MNKKIIGCLAAALLAAAVGADTIAAAEREVFPEDEGYRGTEFTYEDDDDDSIGDGGDADEYGEDYADGEEDSAADEDDDDDDEEEYSVGINYGDVDRSGGKPDNQDLARLQQYVSRWNVTVDERAADVTGDGNIDSEDIARLQQYLSGWKVKLGK